MNPKRAAILAVLSLAAAIGFVIHSQTADATTTWSAPAPSGAYVVSLAETTTGTESAPTNPSVVPPSCEPCDAGAGGCLPCDAGSLTPWPGVALADVRGFTLCVEATYQDGGAFTAGTMQAYVYNPQSTRWARNPSLDVTMTAGLWKQCFAGWQVPNPIGRVAFVPSGVGQPLNVYILGVRNVR